MKKFSVRSRFLVQPIGVVSNQSGSLQHRLLPVGYEPDGDLIVVSFSKTAKFG